MQKRVIYFLTCNNVLIEEQSGFRKGLAADKALYKLIDDVLWGFDDEKFVSGLFCDLYKEFDCIMTLLSKLNFYGIQGKAGCGLNHTLMTETRSGN
jgi:hypothetical protein